MRKCASLKSLDWFTEKLKQVDLMVVLTMLFQRPLPVTLCPF